jgi:hypothetical protein
MSATLLVVGMMINGTPVPQSLDILSKIEVSAVQNNVDPEAMKALMMCESRGNPNAWNKTDPGKFGSRGIFQYQHQTFYGTAKQYGLKDPDIWNYDHQIKITAYLLAQNKWNLWYNCSKSIGMI